MGTYHRDERGFTAILTVAILSLVLITSLMTVYIYVVNRARHYARIKESYKLMNVMEEAAKSVRAGWDNVAATAAAPGGPGNQSCCDATFGGTNSTSQWGAHACTGGTGPATQGCVADIAFMLSTQTKNFIAGCQGGGLPNPPCCAAGCPSGPKADLCVENPDAPSGTASPKPYCFYGLAGNGINQTVQFKALTPDDVPNMTRTEKFLARLDGFFEGTKDIQSSPLDVTSHTAVAQKEREPIRALPVFAWLFGLSEAYSSPSGCGLSGQGNCTNSLGTAVPNCTNGTQHAFNGGMNGGVAGQTTNGCMACGTGTLRACAFIYACPYTFPQCSGYGGFSPWTNANGTLSAQTALFTQQFVLSPPGVCAAGTDPHLCY